MITFQFREAQENYCRWSASNLSYWKAEIIRADLNAMEIHTQYLMVTVFFALFLLLFLFNALHQKFPNNPVEVQQYLLYIALMFSSYY